MKFDDSTVASVAIKQIILERVNFYCQQRLDGAILQQPEVDAILDDISLNMVIRMRGFLWGETVDEHAVQYPANWRESFKDRWFHGWLRRRYPVRLTAVRYDVKAVYPKLNFQLPNDSPRLVMVQRYDI